MENSKNIWTLASDGNVEEVVQLLKSLPVDSQDENGYTALQAAASYGHFDLLQLLLQDYNANPNLKDCDGESALFLVADQDCCTLLLENNADPNIRNNESKLAVEVAFIEKKDDVVLVLSQFTPEWIKYEQEDDEDSDKLEYLLSTEEQQQLNDILTNPSNPSNPPNPPVGR